MVEAWTGVIFVKPMDAIASMIHSAKGGVRASQALGSFFWASGAMMCRVVVVKLTLSLRVVVLKNLSGLIDKKLSSRSV